MVNDDQKRGLDALLRNGHSSQRVALRSRVVLLANQGLANHAIAQQLNVSRPENHFALRAAFAQQGDGGCGHEEFIGVKRKGQGAHSGVRAEDSSRRH